MTEKRFTTDNGSHEDVCLVDNLTKKEYESNFEDMVSLMNDIWNQTQRFEKHNQRLEKENEQLKQEVTHWKKILDNHQQMIAKTLREQYHWLKNEDKIQNNDKTVALLEIESISARLGINLN